MGARQAVEFEVEQQAQAGIPAGLGEAANGVVAVGARDRQHNGGAIGQQQRIEAEAGDVREKVRPAVGTGEGGGGNAIEARRTGARGGVARHGQDT
ncbi:hypothetical protein GCM10007205_24150 [Oxalicibacterium flavum]|uniref:Uncharacterized protein n=1 Tax=Oxalicibacterium flavum TaxID=179467 RepID=A0A8J2UNN8_9BURK|nr:hypothetical protein GCM10007205_24150 [Oxalicibacterium flavum]